MTKIGRPKRLIGYDNDINIQRRQDGKAPIYRIVRARTVAYSAIIAAVGGIMLYVLATRTLLDVNVLHDRNPVAVRLSDGSIRNAYTVRLLNKSGYDRVVAIDADGPANATIHVVGADSVTPDRPMIVIPRDSDQRAAAARHRAGRQQSGEVDPRALPRHRYRARRGRHRHRQFRRAVRSRRLAMATKPLTGTKVFLMLVAFFGVVIGVNVTMMKLAIATLPGTDVDSPYAAGLTYDREISAAQDQAARKWQVSAHIERRADGNAVLQVEARDAAGQPLTGLEIRRPPGAADRQARRSRGRARGGRHRHLSRQCRVRRAGPVGSRHRGRCARASACSCRATA